MASASAAPPLSERADIHRSCKTLETLVNALNDYCEAAAAIVSLQKKLAKALRDTAGLKITGDIAANAFNASASIFDALSDTDNKFAKVADKECEGISTEVRKWFKKLAKEEKAHDERVSNANARIKQAGQVYEKKSKKSARDATEEHVRYINLISTLGPEISQDKYNHALLVTQRHTSATYAVAACASRVADAEWLRSCEEVRRFAPTVGQLGEWRALCEGGWTGAVPQALPDLDEPQSQSQSEPQPQPQSKNGDSATASSQTEDGQPPRDAQEPSTPALERRLDPDYGRFPIGAATPPRPHYSSAGHSIAPSSQGSSSALDPPRPSFEHNADSVASFASLTSFPAPPTHFPIPPAFTAPQSAQVLGYSLQPPTTASAPASNGSFPPAPRVTDSPTSLHNNEDEIFNREKPVIPSEEPQTPSQSAETVEHLAPAAAPETTRLGTIPTGNTTYTNSPEPAPATIPARRQSLLAGGEPSTSQGAEKTSSSGPMPGPSIAPVYNRGDYLTDDREFGTRNRGSDTVFKGKGGVERTDTGTSSGSIVAAMCSRYTHATGASSPPPRDLPKLPLSVSNLATRYQPADGGLSPSLSRPGAVSPPAVRPRAASSATRPPPMTPTEHALPSPYDIASPAADDEVSARRRRQRLEELAEFDLKEREYELREREREVESRARELERERAVLISARQSRPVSQVEFPNGAGRYSYSTTHLVPPSPSLSQQPSQSQQSHSSNTHSQYSRSQPPTPVADQQQPLDHAPFCGCDTCSVAKYKLPVNHAPSPYDLRPPEKPINLRPEKTKGWMRRLSMPVGGAFSLDSKKAVARNSVALEDGRMGVGTGISNRSMTNLGVSRR